ncbi:hypothetical protein JTB14_025873 [Gonioctena quinquepunctata]|nr:hypothetical protein JTB14_025873 [Gonioctena quinquepunctata]
MSDSENEMLIMALMDRPGRYRLYISNLSNSITKEDVENTFKAYGEVNDVFIQPNKNFGFVRMDYPHNALKAKKDLNGTIMKERKMYITFSPQASVTVKHLSPFVSNELLHLAFSVFGEIDCCFIITDKRGKSTGEGVVDFVKKSSAISAKKHCTDKMFFVTSSLKPVTVEDYNPPPDTDGLPEETVRKSREFYEDRDMGPRFAIPGAFEYQYAERFKDLWSRYSLKIDMLKSELESEEQKLEVDMMRARYDHETERLKEMIRQRELEKERFCKKMDVQPRQTSRDSHAMDSGPKMEFKAPDLFMQANQLNEILDTEERNIQEQWRMADYRSEYEMSSYQQEQFHDHAANSGTRRKIPEVIIHCQKRQRFK